MGNEHVSVLGGVQLSRPGRSRTFVSALSEQRPVPLDDRAKSGLCMSVGMVGLEPTIPCSQSKWGAAPLHPEVCEWLMADSEWLMARPELVALCVSGHQPSAIRQ